MSQKNVEIVRSIYGAWAREEFPGPSELMDPDIEYVRYAWFHGSADAFEAAGLPVKET